MAATSDIVLLGPADTAAAMLLSAAVGWNQIEADWHVFFTAGRVFGLRDDSGRLIATAALLPHGDGQAWISMVLVAADWQRRGLATRLMQRCIADARGAGWTCWLDATPDGAAVYAKLGFAPVAKLQRLGLQSGDVRSAAVTTLTSNELIAQDRSAMGFDRSALLSDLAARPRSHVFARSGALALLRDGRKARHIGPVVADNVEDASSLIAAITSGANGPFLIDAHDDDRGLIARLIGGGWQAQRPFLRMRLGASRVTGDGRAFAGAGPEFG